MGIILKFEAPRGRGDRARVAGGRKVPCEVVILPCIRYEHSVDVGQKPKPQKKARKPRARATRRAQ